ncbi:MAG: sensor histidine kinase [Bacteroidetes bacterium]|nr:sensor histidine kinase [Bacteroidota bacterium]
MASTERNITPRQLSLLAALILSAPESVLVIWATGKWELGLLSFVMIFGISYLVIATLLERFIDRKIKLIYKFIHKTKATKKEEIYYKYLLPKKTIEEVSKDVEDWARENQQEMELLRQNEQFRKEFLQNLSHEFKTPIFAIQGYIETLLGGAMQDPAFANRYLENASRNVERLSNLLADLEQISKLERGELPLAKKPFIIQEVILAVFDALSHKANAAEIYCEIKKGSTSPLLVYADEVKIKQVLLNLVENAIKYGKQHGKIIASIYKIEEQRALIEISDDGIGIPEKDLSRIFERFYRTESGRSRDITGSGLGLAICKHIIEAHEETIHVRSTAQVGTTIGFTLPLH